MFRYAKEIFFSFLTGLLLYSLPSVAQTHPVKLDVPEKLERIQQKIWGTTVMVANSSETPFKGYLLLRVPDGLQAISRDTLTVDIEPADSLFMPIRLMESGRTPAGLSEVGITLTNRQHQHLATQHSSYTIAVDNTLLLHSTGGALMNANPGDSLNIAATVRNPGNVDQRVILIFSIPHPMADKRYVEVTGTVPAHRDSTFNFRLMPSPTLLALPHFNVNVTGMRGRDKQIFGTTTVFIQNLSSSKKYQETDPRSYLGNLNSGRGITASIRTLNNANTIYQLNGSGHLNLPAGSLALTGSLYKNNMQERVFVTNTQLSYQLENNTFTIGNISEPHELSLFGRGLKIDIADGQQKKRLQAGLIDPQYNLADNTPLFTKGYGIFVIGELGHPASQLQRRASFIAQNDVMEGAHHYVLGGDIRWHQGKWGSFNLSSHAGWSEVSNGKQGILSGSAELQVNGNWKTTRMTGNYYYSTPYFPGNRKGLVSVQQNLSQQLSGDRLLWASGYYSTYQPRSLRYNLAPKTHNARTELGLSLPPQKKLGTHIVYQYQYESTNINGVSGNGRATMDAHRLVERFNWTSEDKRHSAQLNLEHGIVRYPEASRYTFQMKTNAAYRIKGLELTAAYQQGAYYLSEYISASAYDGVNRRLTTTVNTDHKFANQKLDVKAGIAFANDFSIGKAPSANLGITYTPWFGYSFYLHSAWYRYDYRRFNSLRPMDVLSIESGVKINFQRSQPSTSRKGKITGLVFYDKNANNTLDQGEQPAAGYVIVMDNSAFITNGKGMFTYFSAPFGTYRVQSGAKGGWFHTGSDVVVHRRKTTVQIPLQQTGTLQGKIQYRFDPIKAKDFVPVYSGIAIRITKEGQFIQRIFTDNSGSFTAFLPADEYQIEIESTSLPDQATCVNQKQSYVVKSGKLAFLPPFIIDVNKRKINMKHFGQ